ncbi:MAG: bifunctional riboflavin kinase/FAD synthetase [Chthoniobacterales bacterium]|nr:bifunctional riboflavin kinase/FAD synthetase [Chthoniobacterales bacterium]
MDTKFQLIHDLKGLQSSAFSLQPVILVGGTFDGVHVGHQALIAQAQEEAKAIGGKVVVMTFDRHPVSLLRPSVAPALLTTTEQKLKLLQELGVDAVLLLTFNEQLAAIPATEFITQLVEALPHLKTIAIGASWSFGKGGEGNLDLLKELGEKFHFSVMTIKPIEVNGSAVSSTRIRRAIASGELEEAAACLGRRYSLTGTVVEGNKKARDFGFPTANLSLPPIQLPPNGVYAVLAKVGETTHQGIANIGHCPTISDFPFPTTVEVHLFNFEGDLYGQELTMIPIAYLRPEIKFPNLEELRLQIIKDVEVVKEILQKKN